MKRRSILVIAFLASTLSVAQAQSLSFDRINYRHDASRGLNGKPEFRFTLFPSGAVARPRQRRIGLSLMPMVAGPNLPVVGSGTVGRLTKWTGFNSSNSFIGDSTIFEDKLGLVGIGTDSPTSRLTVNGLIQSLGGGFQFPDGSVQTTSAAGSLFKVTHDITLEGDGTAANPLGIRVPLSLIGNQSDPTLSVLNQISNCTGCITALAFGSENGVALAGAVGAIQGRPNTAVQGASDSGIGVLGESSAAFGVVGEISNTNEVTAAAVRGTSFSQSPAAIFDGAVRIRNAVASPGNLEVAGNLSVTGTKNFKIDHPLDPENKYLIHAAVESSEVLNVYSGNVKLDANGEAIVRLPAWFQAINRDFRYSLTPVGAPASGLYIAQEIADGRFKIAGGVAEMKVSWQVTGVRSDRALLKRPFTAEQQKPEQERGTYLNPEAYDQPEERGLERARHPDLMREMKQRREQMKKLGSNDR